MVTKEDVFLYLNVTRDALEADVHRQIARSLNTRHEQTAGKFWGEIFGMNCERFEVIASFVEHYGPDVLEDEVKP